MKIQKGNLLRVFSENLSLSILFILAVIIHFSLPMFSSDEEFTDIGSLTGMMLLLFFLAAFSLRFYLLRRCVHWMIAALFMLLPIIFLGFLSFMLQEDGRLGFLSLSSIIYYYYILRTPNWPSPQNFKEIEVKKFNAPDFGPR
ncbi:MAG: hypothetical protein Q4G54_09050 [Pelistega sp.]|nr:hypothetical protein [Pelistega sp.]